MLINTGLWGDRPAAIAIDQKHSNAQGLVHAFVPTPETFHCLVTGESFKVNFRSGNNGLFNVGKYGLGLDGSNDVWVFNDHFTKAFRGKCHWTYYTFMSVGPQSPNWCQFGCMPGRDDEHNNPYIRSGLYRNSSTQSLNVRWQGNGMTSTNERTLPTSGLLPTTASTDIWHIAGVFVMDRSATQPVGTSDYRFYWRTDDGSVDDFQDATFGGSTPEFYWDHTWTTAGDYASDVPLGIFGHGNTAHSSERPVGTLYHQGYVSRAWSDGECRAFIADPWCFLRKEEPVVGVVSGTPPATGSTVGGLALAGVGI